MKTFCLLWLMCCLSIGYLHDIENCVEHIWHSYGNSDCPSILIIYDNEFPAPFKECAQYIYKNNESIGDLDNANNNLVVFSFVDLDNLTECLKQLDMEQVVLVMHDEKKGSVSAVFEVQWQYYLSNVVVVTKTLDVYTYYPYTQGGCNDTSAFYLGKCMNVSMLTKESNTRHFRNCKVAVKAFAREPFIKGADYLTNTGFEVFMFRLISERLELSSHVSIVTLIEPNVTFDVLIGGVPILSVSTANVAALYYYEDEIAFYTLMLFENALWRNTIRVFDVKIWVTLLLVLLCLVLTFHQDLKTITNSFLVVFSSLMSVSSRIPTRHPWLFLLWMYTAFLLTSAYKSLLLSFMFKSSPALQITDPAKMVEAKFEFGEGLEYPDLFDALGRSDQLWNYYNNHKTQCDVNDARCFDLMKKGNFAYLTFTLAFIQLMDQFKFYKVVKGPPIWKGFISMIVANPVMAKRFQHLIRYLDESGIIRFLDKSIHRKPETKPKFATLTLMQLQFIFIVYGVCILIGTTTFIVELFGKKNAGRQD